VEDKITDQCLIVERPHKLSKTADVLKDESWRGVQRIYKLPNSFGLSLVNVPALRSYPFAWEAAVLTDVKDNGDFGELTYDTPLTNDVEVFMTTGAANSFINRAIEWASSQSQLEEAQRADDATAQDAEDA
jgi:hypothetical protein